MAKPPAIIDLLTLGEPPGLPALDIATGRMFADAAAVCLEHNEHASGACLAVLGVKRRKYCLNWPSTTDQIRRSHNDLQDATTHGAYAVAISVAKEVTGLTVVNQSRKGTGFDYWLGDDEDNLFQEAARLEVSGILKGEDTHIKTRLRVKKKQMARSDSLKLTGYACVVEFSRPQAHLVKR